MELAAIVEPENAANQNVTWTNGDDSIATVLSSDLVAGIAKRIVVITDTTVDGSCTATCQNRIPV
ncbi:MAG: Ig-like domain-containing protein [Spirochaetota bacterium]|nr:Ig-like domain-containing protein [Spirochaetota bacterium]